MNQKRRADITPAPAPPATPSTVSVVLPADARPGVLRVGAYVPGKVYPLPADKAAHLVAAKGFEPATAEDAAALRAASEPVNAAAPSVAATPSYAGGQGGGTSSDYQE